MKYMLFAFALLAAPVASMADTSLMLERLRQFDERMERLEQKRHQERVERELRKQTRLMEEQARRERRAKKKGDHLSERGK